MSTSCVYAVYTNKGQDFNKPDFCFRQHSDGFPDEVLPVLVPYLQFFARNRGMEDTGNLGARLLQHIANASDTALREIYKRQNSRPSDDYFTREFSIMSGFSFEMSYLYRIYPGYVEVYECTDYRARNRDGFKILKKIRLFKIEDNKMTMIPYIHKSFTRPNSGKAKGK